MGQVLILLVFYSVCAAVVLIWTTLLDAGRVWNAEMPSSGIQFVPLPECSLFELAEQDPSLVIFDVHANRKTSGRLKFISHWLPISAGQLPIMLKLLPPGSRVVLCCKDAIEQIDTHTKRILLQLGIKTVYFVSDYDVMYGNRWFDPEVTMHNANRKLRKTTIIETRRRL